MKLVKVFFEDSDYLTTRFNGTEKEINEYYVGKVFNLGVAEDRVVRAIGVEFLDMEAK